ncbi:MAG TPA: DUF2188 domain-containing protein [Polyangiaceae bacterium]|nr:DUF2188 domain-containing protein [Polyangiaceae bacterium]
MSRAVYDVVPMNDGWLVRMAGNSHSEWHAGKDEALHAARRLAREADEWQVRVFDISGKLETELHSPPVHKAP